MTRLYGNKRIWITEYGYQTNPPDRIFGVSCANQARYLTQAYGIAKRNPRIDMFIWFLLRDERRRQRGLAVRPAHRVGREEARVRRVPEAARLRPQPVATPDALFRRNVLGIYAVYAAAIVSGLIVTPIVLHALGTEAFGIWSFIGSVTIYLSVLDFGVGPSIIRFAAEARGRQSSEDTNALASVGLALYAVIGLATLPIGVALAWLVPDAGDHAGRPRLARAHLDAARRALDRGPLPARPLQQPARRAAALRPAEPRELRVDGALRRARRHLSCPGRRADPARRADARDDAAAARAAACCGSVASCPELRLRRAFVSRARGSAS